MSVIGIDLGGTKLSAAVFNSEGTILHRVHASLGGKTGPAVGELMRSAIMECRSTSEEAIQAVGIAVPGISRQKKGTVWAPNIQGWDDYPLRDELNMHFPELPVIIESDRSCYIMGECWQGNAKHVHHAIFLAFGTGIGAGILVDGKILRGAHDIAGAIGWWSLGTPFDSKYIPCGFFEHHASGEGLRKVAMEYLQQKGLIGAEQEVPVSTAAIFKAYEEGEAWAQHVIGQAIQYWGMAAANLISIFDPEVIVFGGGVFGPAIPLIPAIRQEAERWAQPVSSKMVAFVPSVLGGEAGVYGAGYFALSFLLNK